MAEEKESQQEEELGLWSQEILVDVLRIKAILGSNIFATQNRKHPLKESAVIELMICLNDLLAKAKQKGLRISFTDDIVITPKIKDITDLVAVIRNAACHIPSGNRHVDDYENRLSGMGYGKTVLGSFNGVVLESEYEDDIAFFYGHHRIYLARHILRAFKEAKKKLAPLNIYHPQLFE